MYIHVLSMYSNVHLCTLYVQLCTVMCCLCTVMYIYVHFMYIRVFSLYSFVRLCTLYVHLCNFTSGCMLAFQKSPGQIIFWQFANQSVNAAVNFTNRSGDEEIPTLTLARNFAAATSLAVFTAMGVKRFAPK